MNNEKIFAKIEKDISDVYNGCFGLRNLTIWMTKELFNKLYQEQYILQENSAITTLFGCKIKIVIFPENNMQWIVGYEGTVEEDE